MLTQGTSRIMPDRMVRTANYRRVLLNRKGKVDCKALYRTIMRLEKPLRRSKARRHRFIRQLFTAACNPEIDYNTIVHWLKANYKISVTVVEVRQLVLYSGIFGETDDVNPPNSIVRYVLKHCVMSVPRLHMFKRWCKDVKRLEKFPEEKDRSRGYFSTAYRDDETCTIQSLIQDFQTYDDMDDDEKGDIFDDGDDDQSVDSVSVEEISMKDKLKKGIRNVITLNKIGFMTAGLRQKEKPAYVPRRKTGNANLYSNNVNNTPEFNKFIANLNKGDTPSASDTLMKEPDELDIRFNQRARCTDSMFVKNSYRKMKEDAAPVETEPEVDVDIIIDIMKDSIQEKSSHSKKQVTTQPTARQSMAVLMFNQSAKFKKKPGAVQPMNTTTANKRCSISIPGTSRNSSVDYGGNILGISNHNSPY